MQIDFQVAYEIQALPGQACDRTRTRQLTLKSIYAYDNSYVQTSITNIASYARKLSKILYNGLETRVHFLEISLKFKYFWNITRSVTRE